ncbi:MAG: ATP-binding protein [Rhodospirillales bacterium]
MSLITGALGGYGLYVLTKASGIVVYTYDQPLMAINFARAASLDFAQMDNESLRAGVPDGPGPHPLGERLAGLAESFRGNLEVADERSLADDERKAIAEIRSLFDAWQETWAQGGGDAARGPLDAIAARIVDRFDVLTELIAGNTFVARRKAVWSIYTLEATSAAAIGIALLLAAAITLVLTRRIVRPLSAAAAVADRIAAGELQTPIPEGGRDETGALLRSMHVMQDSIRQMMEREQAQRRSAQGRLIDAVESSQEGMILVDAEDRIALVNTQVGSFFPAVAPYIVPGAAFRSVLALISKHFVYQIMPDQPDSAATDLGRGNKLFFVGEYLLTDGRWVRISRSNTRDGGFFLFVSDFTDIKQREEHFRDAKLKAEEASAAKTNFLANMSHELRTPLNAIIGFSEFISGEFLGKVGNPKYVDYARDIQGSGRHLLDVINSVLDIAKSEAGKLDIKHDEVDLAEVLRSCATMTRDQCAQAGLEFETSMPAAEVVIHADSAKLRQVVLNLLSNAVKFTGAGGRVMLSGRDRGDGTVEIVVADTGIGMSPGDIEIALTPFGQVDKGLARRYEGTGLGLPLTKAFVELHGGRLTIDSAPGRGTTVTAVVPRQATLPADVPAPLRAAG